MQVAIRGILAIIILGLGYFLYISITEPYEAVERQKELTQMTRDRMSHIRTAMTMYERENDRFLTTLDSLVLYIKSDSVLSIPANADSIFGIPGFSADSLLVSPRTGNPFALTVNDTSDVKIYLLEDPDSDDYIGSTEPVVTRLNAASWE